MLLPAFLCPSEIEWGSFFIRSDLQRLLIQSQQKRSQLIRIQLQTEHWLLINVRQLLLFQCLLLLVHRRHLHTGYSTADRLLLRTHRILKGALTLLAAESFTRERLAVDSIAVYSQTLDSLRSPDFLFQLKLCQVNSKEISSYRRINSQGRREKGLIPYMHLRLDLFTAWMRKSPFYALELKLELRAVHQLELGKPKEASRASLKRLSKWSMPKK